MAKEHHYKITTLWTGNLGRGTSGYTDYERSHQVLISGKPEMALSSDPSFRGDATRHNPEELLVASISSCHMLWYLHFCSTHGVVVLEYEDAAEGFMDEQKNGKGQFTKVILHPRVKVAEETMELKAEELHRKANEYCFIANSCNFPIEHVPSIEWDAN